MSSLFHRNRSWMIPNMRERTSRPRRLLRSLVLAAVALGFIGPQPARAQPAAAWTSSSIVVFGGNEILMCKGEEKTIRVSVKVTTRRLFGSIFGSWTYPRYSKIVAKAAGSVTAITMDPWEGSTDSPPGNPTGAYVDFEISAKDVGTTRITFIDNGNQSRMFGVISAKRPLADDAEMTVTVKKCKFKIAYFNTWLVQEGFINPRMTASFVTEVIPDDDGKILKENIFVEGEVHPTSQPGGNLCTYKTTHLGSGAQIEGTVEFKDDFMLIDLSFDRTRAKYDWKCKSVMVPVEVHKEFSGLMFHITAAGTTHDWSAVKLQALSAAGQQPDEYAAIVVVREYID